MKALLAAICTFCMLGFSVPVVGSEDGQLNQPNVGYTLNKKSRDVSTTNKKPKDVDTTNKKPRDLDTTNKKPRDLDTTN